MKIRVAIVEDVESIRKGLGSIINNSQECECVASFPNAISAINELPEIVPDVILMDIHMPGMKGIEAVKLLNGKLPATQFLMCTVYEDEDYIFDSLKAGANGYILKSTPPDELIAAIVQIYGGGSPMSPGIARKVIGTFQQKDTSATNLLSEKELEIVKSLAKGLRYKEIADAHFISIDTVRSHIRNIYKKLQVQSRMEAINALGNLPRA